jgi:hypothetical protein
MLEDVQAHEAGQEFLVVRAILTCPSKFALDVRCRRSNGTGSPGGT